jgi:hypothetical protein
MLVFVVPSVYAETILFRYSTSVDVMYCNRLDRPCMTFLWRIQRFMYRGIIRHVICIWVSTLTPETVLPYKYACLSTKLHGVTSQQTSILVRYDLPATILSIFFPRIWFLSPFRKKLHCEWEADGNIRFYSGNRALRKVTVFACIRG